MTLRSKLLFALLGVVGLGIVSHEVVYTLRPKPESMQERGLAWLRQEYQIPEDRFRQIEKLHQDYFRQCDLMCAEMVTQARPSPLRLGKRYQPGALDEVEQKIQQQKLEDTKRRQALCERCLKTMVQHLHSVAALMPPEQGRRFLNELLPELTHPRELQELESAATRSP
ncbi:MAG: hypothetical protein LDL31_09535 [Prosthecobacter sp.]|jgi:hypothetical protein|nr:hypothetical protein [Prosthecobacter sp.]